MWSRGWRSRTVRAVALITLCNGSLLVDRQQWRCSSLTSTVPMLRWLLQWCHGQVVDALHTVCGDESSTSVMHEKHIWRMLSYSSNHTPRSPTTVAGVMILVLTVLQFGRILIGCWSKPQKFCIICTKLESLSRAPVSDVTDTVLLSSDNRRSISRQTAVVALHIIGEQVLTLT